MNPRVSTYSRLNSDYESFQVATAQTPIEHNLDVKKLRSRCCLCISAALFIAFVLWMFDPPAGHEAPPSPDSTNTQLKFVVALHRHGARSSLHPYTFEKEIEWEVDPGKLLDAGFIQGFDFGRQLRSQYWSTLSSLFDSSVECFSTDVDRTVDTAHSVLLGLYTDNQTEIGQANCTCRPEGFTRSTTKCVAKCIGLAPQSIPKNIPTVEVWGADSGNDMILRQYDECEGLKEWKQKVYSSNEYKDARSSFQSAFEYVEQEIVGDTEVCPEDGDCHPLELVDLGNIYSNVQCLANQDGGNNGPYEDVEEVSQQLLPPATWLWHQEYPAEIGPSIGGILLDRIINNLEDGEKRKPRSSLRAEQLSIPNKGPLMILYSAHDSTVASLLAAMNVVDWHIPPFTAHVVFELYGPTDPSTKAVDSNHYVRILYDDGPLVVGDCQQDFCLLETFVDSLSDRRRSKADCVRVP